jgi:glutathione S-transferase
MRWLKVLNDHILGSKKTFLTGDTVTIADYFGAAQLSIGELIGTSFRDYPNTDRWLQSMKNCPSWGKVNEEFYDFRDTLKDHKFVTV